MLYLNIATSVPMPFSLVFPPSAIMLGRSGATSHNSLIEIPMKRGLWALRAQMGRLKSKSLSYSDFPISFVFPVLG